MRKTVFIILALMATAGTAYRLTAQTASVSTNINIGIQPLGKMDRRLMIDVLQGIIGTYKNVNITVLQARKLPVYTYYEERQRYRADKLLNFLDASLDTTKIRRIIGITDQEISTSVGEYYDQAVIGLAKSPGISCIVSTARLGRNKVPDKKFKARLIKAVNRELARTLGLRPCDATSCLLNPVGGKVKKLDALSGKPCASCTDEIRVMMQKMAAPPLTE